MNYQGHLLFSGIINGIFLLIIYKFFNVNFLNDKLIFPLFITFYVFSILPDIDHPKSRISTFLFIFVIYLFGSSTYYFFKTFNPMNLLKVVLAVVLFIVHVGYAEDSYLHRRFPHTFTFGMISCVVLFFFVNSIIVVSVGAISFFTHILGDNHFSEALKKDKEIWNFFKLKLKRNG